MTALFFRSLPFVALCLVAFAQDVPPASLGQIGELPGEKISEPLRAKERNPFTRRETKIAEVAEDKESEESQLRKLFAAMPVTGVIRGGGEVKVLLGSLILKQGEPLPSLLEKQTERLVVGPITDQQAELDFVEGDEHAEPRRIFITIDLRPRVAVRALEIPAVSDRVGGAATPNISSPAAAQ
jgi:hypothetical protein